MSTFIDATGIQEDMADESDESGKKVVTIDRKDKERVVICNTDGGSNVVLAAKKLQKERGYTRMTPVLCIAHGVNRACVTIRKQFKLLDRFMTETRNLFTKSPQRRRLAKSHNLLRVPPAPSGTRWGVWIECSAFYTEENLVKLSKVIEDIMKGLMTKAELKVYEQHGQIPTAPKAMSDNQGDNNNGEDIIFDYSDEENDDADEQCGVVKQVTPKRKKVRKTKPRSTNASNDLESVSGATSAEKKKRATPKKKQVPKTMSRSTNTSNEFESVSGVTSVKKKKTSNTRRIRKIQNLAKLMESCFDAEIRNQVKYVQDNFAVLPKYLVKLQKSNVKVKKVIKIVEDIRTLFEKLASSQSPYNVGSIHEHFESILEKNKGFRYIEEFIKNGSENVAIANLSMEQKELLKKAPVVNDAPERIFSMYKSFYRDNRHSFKFRNVHMFVVSKCILSKVGNLFSLFLLFSSDCNNYLKCKWFLQTQINEN